MRGTRPFRSGQEINRTAFPGDITPARQTRTPRPCVPARGCPAGLANSGREVSGEGRRCPGAGRADRSGRTLSKYERRATGADTDRKSTRLNSSHLVISYAVFCLKKKKKQKIA